MYNPFSRDTKNNSLELALKACTAANKEGYEVAKRYLKDLKVSINKATRIINDCVEGLHKYGIKDESLVYNIGHQLRSVQIEFEHSYMDTQKAIYEKSKMDSKFNITLFGRTKTGKSTLMEILTHGDGSRMGKGGQRTTKDIRSYEWNGMTVTDVPGIEAFGGEVDDTKAEEAATFADLILFMITAGQPEKTEADWLVKLKKMDKPLLCICNFKQSVGEGLDSFRLKRLLENPDKLEERMNIDELVAQFNQFVQENLPNEHITFLVTHLLSKFYSQQEAYKTKQAELARVSRFSFLEKAIIQEVLTNGVLHRKKCYLSIIDAPLYQQMNMLFRFSSDAYSQYKVILDKKTSFEQWRENFNSKQLNLLMNVISEEFNKIRDTIPSFVQDNVEASDVDTQWEQHCLNFSISNNIECAVEDTTTKFERKVHDLFSELETEIKFTMQFKAQKKLGNYQFTNWKRGIKWVGLLGGAGFEIAAFLLNSGPWGWVGLGVLAVFSLFSLCFKSRAQKLDERREQLSNKLLASIDKAEKITKKKVTSWFEKNIEVQESQLVKRLSMVARSMLSLSNGERELALGYSKNHKDITKTIIANIFYAMGVSMQEFDRIVCAARIPGKRIALVINGKDNLPLRLGNLSSRLGNDEKIQVIKLDTSKPLESQIVFLLKYFGFQLKPLIKHVNNGLQTVVYLYNTGFKETEFDSIDLIQQILNVHIILTEYGTNKN